jgi:SAM-dependent methyltransferase
MLRRYMHRIYNSAMALNDANVCAGLAGFKPLRTLLDVGCWDGQKTLTYARAADAESIFGIEIVAAQAQNAAAKGILTSSIRADQERWPFEDCSLDAVVSNQVIEHLSDVDHFIGEAARVLRPGGILVTSTNNLSSWHNIGSIVLGWAPFDLTNSSRRANGIGNPLALHTGQQLEQRESWCHKCIYTERWLNDWFSVYGLENVRTYGAGYYPLPSGLGNVLKRHAAFITLVSRKR